MTTTQYIQTPTGERLVVLTEEDYSALIQRLEDQTDIAAADAIRARGDETFPSTVADALINGVSPIRVFREYRGLRASELAARAEITQGYLSGLESGSKTPSVPVLRRLADALNVSLDDLA